MSIENQSDDVTKNFLFFFAFQHSEYQKSVVHDEKPPQPKFGENRSVGAQDMAA